MEIPQRLMGYGEVVVDVRDGVAHAPRMLARSETVERWNDTLGRMVTEVKAVPIGYSAKCWTPTEWPSDEPKVLAFSAAWAASLGYTQGCPDCWPEDR